MIIDNLRLTCLLDGQFHQVMITVADGDEAFAAIERRNAVDAFDECDKAAKRQRAADGGDKPWVRGVLDC